MNSNSLSNKALLITALSTFFVFAFPLLIEVTFSDFVREGEYNSRLGWTLIFIFVGLMHKKRWIHNLLLTPFIITGTADIGYAITFGGVFTTATIEAVMQTDPSEASEFASAYASPTLFSIYAVYWAGCLFLLKQINFDVAQTKTRTTFVYLGILLTIVAGYRITVMGKYYDTIPGVMGSMPSYYAGNIGVQNEINRRQNLINETQLADEAITLANQDSSQTYVFIIGESLNRNHMSVYGYFRPTSPKLDAHSNDLTVFTDAISSHAQTNASLRLALTQANVANKMSSFDSLSVIDIANLAGFKTWWISNQQPLRRTMSAIGSQADETQFLSNDFQGVEVHRFDEFMQPYLQQALDDSAAKKAIFIHMMGSHAQYRNRYPAEFERFTDENVRAFESPASSRQIDAINTYDNSVLYTDHVVADMLVSLEQSDASIKALTLIADHGEEVYDQINVKGHSPDNVTSSMVDIPFITWVSDEFKTSRTNDYQAMSQNADAAFRLDDFYHVAAGIMGISSPYNDATKSLTSGDYEAPKQRKIYRKIYERDLRQN